MPEANRPEVGELGKICIELARSREIVLSPFNTQLMFNLPSAYAKSGWIRIKGFKYECMDRGTPEYEIALKGGDSTLSMAYLGVKCPAPQYSEWDSLAEAVSIENSNRMVFINAGLWNSDDKIIIEEKKLPLAISRFRQAHTFGSEHDNNIVPVGYTFSSHNDREVFKALKTLLEDTIL